MKLILYLSAFGFALCLVACAGVVGLVTSGANVSPDARLKAKPRPVESKEAKPTDELNEEGKQMLKSLLAVYDDELLLWSEAAERLDDSISKRGELRQMLKAIEINPPIPPAFEVRSWETFDKKHRVDAKLVNTERDFVEILKTDGEVVTVELDRLIAKDRVYANESFALLESYRSEAANHVAEIERLKNRISELDESIKLGESAPPTKPTPSVVLKRLEERKIRDEKETVRITRQRTVEQSKKAGEIAKGKARLMMDLLNQANSDIGSVVFESVSVEGDTCTITVSNLWHYEPYQIRFQTAQNLWGAWAKANQAEMVDKSRIYIVDGNGNRVGGSRILGGSMIWVQE